MSSLNTAIQFIREGRTGEARQILEPLLKTEPNNIKAWFWYVETWSALEKRIQILEICLKINPGSSQVTQALQTLRSQQAPPSSYTPPAAQSPRPAQSSSSYSVIPDDSQDDPISSSTVFDNSPVYTPVSAVTAQQPVPDKQKKSWEVDSDSFVDTSMLAKPKSAAKSYAFYDVWMTVLASMDLESYESVLNDPEAGAGRGFEWVAYTGIISGLLVPFSLGSNPQFSELMNMPEFRGLFGNLGSGALLIILALVMALLTPILSVLGLAISAGIQNFLAVLFGGNGHYGRTVYAVAAYLAPITVLTAALGIIPAVGQCLTSLLGIYTIILNVRALRAAHSISIWQALAVMFTPTIIFMILGCLLVFVVGLPGLSS